MKMIYRAKKRQDIVSEQVSFIIGSNFVISFQENPEEDVFEGIRERIRNNKGRIRKMGADYLAYALMDAIIDNYFIVLERQGDRIEDIEDELIKDPTPRTVKKVYNIKRELIYLRKVIWPLRELISQVQKEATKLVRKETRLYFRDLYDHIIQLLDTVETYREMTTGMLDLYISTMSNKMNEIMKVLTIIATIFMPLTFIAGIYGMNFKHMPELDWYVGYPLALFIMGAVSIGMLLYFRKKKWI
jgi:magnesium transporter